MAAGFFSIAETAMMAVNRYRLKHSAQRGNRGVLVGGNFGTGKSHLLEYLQHVARGQNVVTSQMTPIGEDMRGILS